MALRQLLDVLCVANRVSYVKVHDNRYPGLARWFTLGSPFLSYMTTQISRMDQGHLNSQV